MSAVAEAAVERSSLTVSADAAAHAWDRYVATRPEATVYHLSAWAALVERVFGHRTRYLAASAGGDIVGILPVVLFRTPLFGRFATSMPFVNYGGIVADTSAAELIPDLTDEVAAVAARLAAGKPMLGICLGAQMMAAALGARVAPAPVKEIGWAPLTLTAAGEASVLAPLGSHPVLHWHGDNCELPAGCERLAATPHCPVQAFARTPLQLALQFHLETEPARFESWLVGHTVELGKAGIDPREIRRQVHTLGPATRELGGKVLAAWLDTVVGAAA